MFLNLKNHEDVFKKYGIAGTNEIDLRKFNIIIGKNGSGKTRLLKALRDICALENITYVYAYLPDINATFNPNIIDQEKELPLYEVFSEDTELRFENFMKVIENGGYDFLEEILRDIRDYTKYKVSRRTERATNILNDLNDLLKIFIHRRVVFSKNSVLLRAKTSRNDVQLEESLKLMSPGELSLFYLSIYLVILKNRNDKDVALFLDEPELHLHPEVLIQFVKYIRQKLGFSLCCIATHSIFVIPDIDFREVIYIDNGTIQPHNSRLYKDIWNSIIGENQKLSDFLISRDLWKYYEFISECFSLPQNVNKINIKDEQFLKFREYLRITYIESKTIEVLDYGAGDGRLFRIMQEYQRKNSSRALRQVHYTYYDKYRSKPEDLECEVVDSLNSSQESNKKYNSVILMNVLHEIDIEEWEETFSNINKILTDDGFLLVFEVVKLLHGEQPYGNSGYILFGEEQMKVLFDASDIKSIDIGQDDKTNLFIIPKKIIKNVTLDSILGALKLLELRLDDELRRLYLERCKKAHNRQNVLVDTIKYYGFLSQHYLNCKFAVEIIEKNTLLIVRTQLN